MRGLSLIASVLLGATGLVQVIPAAQRAAQGRPQRVGPRPVNPGGPQRIVDPNVPAGQPRDPNPTRCMSLCEQDLRTCAEHCPASGHSCVRGCATVQVQCYMRCPGDAAADLIDAGSWRTPSTQPVLRRVGR